MAIAARSAERETGLEGTYHPRQKLQKNIHAITQQGNMANMLT